METNVDDEVVVTVEEPTDEEGGGGEEKKEDEDLEEKKGATAPPNPPTSARLAVLMKDSSGRNRYMEIDIFGLVWFMRGSCETTWQKVQMHMYTSYHSHD